MNKTLVVVTGQLRNGADNITSWINNVFDLENTHFLFYIWDTIGQVDRDKIHLKCLKKNKGKVLMSSDDVYFFKERTLIGEMERIKALIGDNVEFVIESYNEEYMDKAGELKITSTIKKENNPWWQGMAPVFFINHKAIEYVEKNYSSFDFYYRVQSESYFEKNDYNFLTDTNLTEKDIITSSHSINIQNQVSIKFFGGRLASFKLLMNAYKYVIPYLNNYIPNQAPTERPIGERFLKQLCKKFNLKTHYICEMTLNREELLPLSSIWVNEDILNEKWAKANVNYIEAISFFHIKQKIILFIEATNLIRDSSLIAENKSDMYEALKFISLARKMRPEGGLISRINDRIELHFAKNNKQ